jgi:hypothetical protein
MREQINADKSIWTVIAEDARKAWCQLLGKLYIPESIDENRSKNLLLLISQMSQVRSHILCHDHLSDRRLTAASSY